VALAAARAAGAGTGLSEAISVANDMKERVHAIALLDTIKHVYRSGRIPKIAATFGSVLNIRPIFTVSGTVNFAGVVRNRKRGIERILQMMREKVGGKAAHVAVMHAYAPEEAEELKAKVAAEFECAELWLAEFSPLMGYACGTGTLGLAFYTED
jgi:DegV family protein with EDD domain